VHNFTDLAATWSKCGTTTFYCRKQWCAVHTYKNLSLAQ